MIGAESITQGVGADFLSGLGELDPLYQRRGVYLLREVTPHKVLKQLKVGAQQALLIGKLLRQSRVCPVLPQIFESNSGKPYHWFRGSRYILIEFLEGREADYFNLEDLQAAIQAMKELHCFGKELIAQNPRIWSPIKINLLKTWQRRLAEMETCREIAIRQKTGWSQQYLQLWHHHGTLAHQAIHELLQWRGKEIDTICYHDWAFHNLIIKEAKARLFDFDYMIVDYPVHDKCNLIARYLRLFQWSLDSTLRILWNFDHYYPWSSEELRLLLIMLTFPYDYWILGRQYFLEKQPWSMRYYQEQWMRKIGCFKKKQLVFDLLNKLM
jgi:CotS family spore coat protein